MVLGFRLEDPRVEEVRLRWNVALLQNDVEREVDRFLDWIEASSFGGGTGRRI